MAHIIILQCHPIRVLPDQIHECGTRTCEYPERIPLAASQLPAVSRHVYLPISRNEYPGGIQLISQAAATVMGMRSLHTWLPSGWALGRQERPVDDGARDASRLILVFRPSLAPALPRACVCRSPRSLDMDLILYCTEDWCMYVICPRLSKI